MKKRSFKVVIVAIMLCFSNILIGCGNEEPSSATELVQKILSSKNLKSFYNYAVDGEEIYKTLSKEQKLQAQKVLDNLKATNDDKKEDIEFKEVQDENSDYIRVLIYNKGSATNSEKDADIFYIKKSDDKYRFDPSINGYNETYISDYIDKGLIGQKTFKVYAKLNGDYEFENKELEDDYYVLSLSDAYNYKSLNGFVEKDSEEGKKIKDLLSNGEERQLTLKVQVPDMFKGGEGKVIIDKIVSFNWIY